jgi:hypothetical protein
MPKSTINGVWNKLDTFNPGFIRLLAADRELGHATALSDEQIASRCALSVTRIQQIYWLKSWDTVPYGDIKEFFSGCGFDLNKSRDVKFIMSKAINPSFKWKHLAASPSHRLFRQICKHHTL